MVKANLRISLAMWECSLFNTSTVLSISFKFKLGKMISWNNFNNINYM